MGCHARLDRARDLARLHDFDPGAGRDAFSASPEAHAAVEHGQHIGECDARDLEQHQQMIDEIRRLGLQRGIVRSNARDHRLDGFLAELLRATLWTRVEQLTRVRALGRIGAPRPHHRRQLREHVPLHLVDPRLIAHGGLFRRLPRTWSQLGATSHATVTPLLCHGARKRGVSRRP